ncbi:MAG: T9SS type A sorting domain-containing protein [Bacteroidia bacterium]
MIITKMTIQMNLKTAFKAVLLVLFLISNSNDLFSQMGINGSFIVSGTNRDLNTRTKLTADASSGATSLTVTNSSLNSAYFPGNLATGDLILIIQMQGASISNSNSATYGAITNYNSAGLYEFRCVSSVPNSTTIDVSVPLTNDYSASGHTQIIRVPRYTSFNLPSGNSVRPAAWDGNVGGVTVIEVLNNATINGTITASGRGFRGGAFENNTQAASSNITIWRSTDDRDGGNKGEGIAGFETEYDAIGGRFGRGAPANGGGGGNSHNAGGGGGANAGDINLWNGLGNPDNSGSNWWRAWNLEGGSFSTNTSSGGGRGGYTYGRSNQNAITVAPGNSSWSGNDRLNVGGYGGRPLDYSTGRIFMGGGGGAGDGNNSAASGGADGGGLILIICYGNITGNGVIVSDGETAANTSAAHNDAPGGGGAGGTIVLSASGSIANTLVLKADGGNGGNQLITNSESEGPGGGGSGGYIAISGGSPIRSTNAGVNGTTSSSALTEFIPNGATAGAPGIQNASINTATIIGSAIADAGDDLDFCETVPLEASISPNSFGTWNILSGVGGSFSDIHDPNAVFTGDSFTSYLVEWVVFNNLCEYSYDSVILNPICQPLTAQLLNISADFEDDEVIIQWSTASEENMLAYSVERQTNDKQWIEIARVENIPNAYTLNNYLVKDVNPQIGENNYRLKMIENDQSYKYSKTVSVSRLNSKNKYIAYPVPVGNTLSINGVFKSGTVVSLYDLQGKLLETLSPSGNENVHIDFSRLNTGVYLLKITRNEELLQAQTIFRE